MYYGEIVNFLLFVSMIGMAGAVVLAVTVMPHYLHRWSTQRAAEVQAAGFAQLDRYEELLDRSDANEARSLALLERQEALVLRVERLVEQLERRLPE